MKLIGCRRHACINGLLRAVAFAAYVASATADGGMYVCMQNDACRMATNSIRDERFEFMRQSKLYLRRVLQGFKR